MKTYEVHRAQDILKSEPVEPATLIVGRPIPYSIGATALADARAVFDADARAVHSALRHLPGGTLDALLVLLLDAKRSHFVVQNEDGRARRTKGVQR